MLILEFLRLFSLHHSQVDDGGDEEEDGGEVALPDDLPNFGGAECLVEKGYRFCVACCFEFETFLLSCTTLHAAPLPRLQVYPIRVLAECSELCP